MTDNELIAEFMGAEVIQILRRGTDSELRCYGFKGALPHPALHDLQTNCGLFHTALRFDTSWDWLMPVVERIEKLGHHVAIETGFVEIGNDDVPVGVWHEDGDNKIKLTYIAVVEFINWYNEQKAES